VTHAQQQDAAEHRMTCKELCSFLGEYLDGQLTPHQTALFEQHMRDCAPCVDYLESYKKTISTCKSCHCDEQLAIENPPEALVDAVMQTLRAQGLCGKKKSDRC
jgi:anti-sigma factor RsiW